MASRMAQRVVLLADDDVLIRNLLRRNLESAGFLVLAARDAEEALALSREYPACIQVLLADVELPGMDGIELAQQITRERSHTKVLLMSAGTTRTLPERVAFISKPFSPTELTAKLQELLGVGGNDSTPD